MKFILETLLFVAIILTTTLGLSAYGHRDTYQREQQRIEACLVKARAEYPASFWPEFKDQEHRLCVERF